MIQSVKLVYFSPTGTTKKIIHTIAHSISYSNLDLFDITKPDARKQVLKTSENDLLIVGVPVYMGRVPAIAAEWLQTIQAKNTPTVCVVIYGNRAYDNALLELNDILTTCGCNPIAAGVYIGEHSFSSPELPIAQGRPDAKDIEHAILFGRKINKKLQCGALAALNIIGNRPYGGVTQLWSVDFIAINNNCTQCGICARSCPTGAIDNKSIDIIDHEKCITCCACIKNCPQSARIIKAGLVKDASMRLNKLYSGPKSPVIFI